MIAVFPGSGGASYHGPDCATGWNGAAGNSAPSAIWAGTTWPWSFTQNRLGPPWRPAVPAQSGRRSAASGPPFANAPQRMPSFENPQRTVSGPRPYSATPSPRGATANGACRSVWRNDGLVILPWSPWRPSGPGCRHCRRKLLSRQLLSRRACDPEGAGEHPAV